MLSVQSTSLIRYSLSVSAPGKHLNQLKFLLKKMFFFLFKNSRMAAEKLLFMTLHIQTCAALYDLNDHHIML